MKSLGPFHTGVVLQSACEFSTGVKSPWKSMGAERTQKYLHLFSAYLKVQEQGSIAAFCLSSGGSANSGPDIVWYSLPNKACIGEVDSPLQTNTLQNVV